VDASVKLIVAVASSAETKAVSVSSIATQRRILTIFFMLYEPPEINLRA
jgi:hypothetical protein